MPEFKKAMSGKKNLYNSNSFKIFQSVPNVYIIYVYKTIYEGNLVDEYAKCAW